MKKWHNPEVYILEVTETYAFEPFGLQSTFDDSPRFDDSPQNAPIPTISLNQVMTRMLKTTSSAVEVTPNGHEVTTGPAIMGSVETMSTFLARLGS